MSTTHDKQEQAYRVPSGLCLWEDHVWGPEGRSGYCSVCTVARGTAVLIGQPSWLSEDVSELARTIHALDEDPCDRCLELAAHTITVVETHPRAAAELALGILKAQEDARAAASTEGAQAAAEAAEANTDGGD